MIIKRKQSKIHRQDIGSWSVSLIPDYILCVNEYLTKLDSCVQNWFQHQVQCAFDYEKSMLIWQTKKNVKTVKQTEWLKSREYWFRSQSSFLSTIQHNLRVDTEDARRYTFKTHKSCGLTELSTFLTEQSRLALNGGYTHANPVHSWKRNGEGIWSHVCPAEGFRLFAFIHDAIKVYLNIHVYTQALPYIVYKPIGGVKEHAYFSHITPPRLYQLLCTHVQSTTPDMKAWMRIHGVHVIAHVRGWSSMFVLDPMTPWRYVICLSLVHPSHFHSDMRYIRPSWWDTNKNKRHVTLFDDVNNLTTLNRIIAYFESNGTMSITHEPDLTWLSKFQHSSTYHIVVDNIPPMSSTYVPLKVRPVSVETKINGCVVLCAHGFPFGYYANRETSRVSIQLPLTTNRPENPSWIHHIQHMIHYITQQNEHDFAWLKTHTLSYKVDHRHICPQKITELIMGYFRPMMPTNQDLSLFLKQFE